MENEGARCEGCGGRVGPLGCCLTVSKLRSRIAVLEITLKGIAGTRGKTMLGRCCVLGECQPMPGGAGACSFQSGVNAGFEKLARAAEGAFEEIELSAAANE